MQKLTIILFIILPIWAYIAIFHLSYYPWPFPLTQNWFMDNGLILYRDVIYHHTPLPLFLIYFFSKIIGDTPFMLQITSFLLTATLGYSIYFTGKLLSSKIGNISLLIFILSFFAIFQNFNIEEMTAAIFTLLSTYFLLKFWRTKSYVLLFLSGLSAGLGIMGKQVTVGLIPVVIIITVIHTIKNKEQLSIILKKNCIYCCGIFLSVLPFVGYFFINNALYDFIYWNIIFNLTEYPKQSAPYGLKEGISTGGWLFFSIIPGTILLFKKNLKLYFHSGLLIFILTAIFISPSLLPSFLTYKILPFFAYLVLLWAITFQYIKEKIILVLMIIGIILFLPLAKSFYVDYLPSDISFKSNYILDYGENELNVVKWIASNTSEKERIVNLGHHYITTLSKRLPANKYVYLFPWLVSPYEVSTREILKKPPRVVILDNKTISDFPELREWPFLNYLRNNYKPTAKFGTYEIFIPKKS